MAPLPLRRRGVPPWWRSRASRDNERVAHPPRRRDSLPSSCVQASSGGLAAAGFGLAAGGVFRLALCKALLQSIHQIDDLAGLRLRRTLRQRLVAQLRLHEFTKRRFEIVFKCGGVEFLAVGLDQLLSHGELSFVDSGRLDALVVVGGVAQLFLV